MKELCDSQCAGYCSFDGFDLACHCQVPVIERVREKRDINIEYYGDYWRDYYSDSSFDWEWPRTTNTMAPNLMEDLTSDDLISDDEGRSPAMSNR